MVILALADRMEAGAAAVTLGGARTHPAHRVRLVGERTSFGALHAALDVTLAATVGAAFAVAETGRLAVVVAAFTAWRP
jgi:hypothetical protein